MTELGKSAKREGHLHPSVIRRTDKDPPKATPPRVQHSRKRYGYSYEHRNWGGKGFSDRLFRCWFGTAKARDQAMAKAERDSITWCKTLNDMRAARGLEANVTPWSRNYQPIQR